MPSTNKDTFDIPTDPFIRAAWVVFQLRKKNSSLRKIAEAEGVTPSAISGALYSPSSHLEDVIAAALDLTARQLFSERFDETGDRRSPVKPQQRSMGSERPARSKGGSR